jgi:hypothetical protein
MPDWSLVLAALASAAAQAEGHHCGAFTVRPDGLVSCLCGQFTFEPGRPVTGTAVAA